jgi:hypothetical protein
MKSSNRVWSTCTPDYKGCRRQGLSKNTAQYSGNKVSVKLK